MQKLSIPLHSNTTARQPRRAVWGLILIPLCLIMGIILIQAWFTRDTLAVYAPENTAITIRLIPTKQTWPILLNNFSNLALVKNQGLNLSMIAPYVKGEISLFVLNDYSRVLAFHGDIPDEFVSLLLSSGYHVQTQSNTVVISKNEYIPTENPTKAPFFSRIYPDTFGQIVINNTFEVTKLKLTDTALKASIGTLPETTTELNLSNELILALSIPAREWVSLFQNHVSQQLVNYLSKSGGQIKIWQDLNKNLYIELEINKSLTENELVVLHDQLLALSETNIQTKTLSDGTKTLELQYNFKTEQESLSKLGSMISIDSENLSSVTNESVTTITYTSKSSYLLETVNFSEDCRGNPTGFLNPLSILTVIQDNNLTYTNNTEVIGLLTSFVHISLDKQGKTNIICAFF